MNVNIQSCMGNSGQNIYIELYEQKSRAMAQICCHWPVESLLRFISALRQPSAHSLISSTYCIALGETRLHFNFSDYQGNACGY